MSFIDDHDFSVGLVLRVLGIPASTYYEWRARAASPSQRHREDTELLERIAEIRSAHEFAATYGSPRVWLQLRRQSVRCSRKRVELLMRENGLVGAHLRKGWKTGSTRQNPAHTAAPDLVERDFATTSPNRLWVADLTRLITGEGVLWLASVRDAFSNRIVAWKTAIRADTDLVLAALDYGLWSRDVQDWQLIHHSDKGRHTPRSGSPHGWPMPASHPLLVPSVILSTMPSRRTCGRPSRSSSCTGRARPSTPEPRPTRHCSATSTAGTTPAVSSTVSADCPPTNTIKPTAHNTINSTPIASNRTPP